MAAPLAPPRQAPPRDIPPDLVAPAPRARRGTSPAVLAVLAAVAAFLLVRLFFGGQATLTLAKADLTPLQLRLNDLNDWVGANRNSSPIFLYLINYIQLGVEWLGATTTHLFSHTDVGLGIPQIGWLGTYVLLVVVAYAVGNGKVAALTAAVFGIIALQGLWMQAMDTFALVLAAVLLALFIGLPLGIWAGTSDRCAKILTPVLDLLQIMPAFAYLAPLALLMGIGPAGAITATLIFAIAPVIRLTAHGIRQVPATTLEAVDSIGVTGRQRLATVLLPMAKRTTVIGINQTIMAALSMVTIASLIGAPGLGLTVAQALQSLDVGTAFNAGLAIVGMAIVFDRVATAASVRAELAARAGTDRRRRRLVVIGIGVVLAVVAVFVSRTQLWAAQIGDGWPNIGSWISTVVSDASQWLQLHASVVTRGLRDQVSVWVLNPLESLLTGSPFFMVVLVGLVIAFVAGGLRVAVVVAVSLAAVIALGLWSDAMATLAATLVATVLVMAFGLVFGVWMGRSTRVDSIIRPVLDAAQTMPAFVYLVPFLGLFGASRFTAIVAGVVYAAPAAIKIIADGIAQVPANTIEAARSFGSTRWQVITRVQLPMSIKAITLATNQGLIYALSMVVIGGMVGAGALGYDVVAGLSQGQLFGKGLAAGLTLVFLGVVLDRITAAGASRSARRSRARQTTRPQAATA